MFGRLIPVGVLATALCLSTAAPVAAEKASDEIIVKRILGIHDVTFGGRLFNDWMEWASVEAEMEDAFGEDAFVGGTEFRAARIHMKGDVHGHMRFFIGYDLAGGDASLKDAYVEVHGIPAVGNARVGHIREPFTLEGLTSSKYMTFMEFALPTAFNPWRNSGLMIHNTALDGRMTWTVGAFRDVDGHGQGSGSDEMNYTARVTGTPVWQDGGTTMVHVGGSVSLRNPDGGDIQYKVAPENHTAPVLIGTGEMNVDSVVQFGIEAAGVVGPIYLQGEYMSAGVDLSAEPDSAGFRVAREIAEEATFTGYYVQASWMLTGEHRPFKAGCVARVKPATTFMDDGWGALELAVRYSVLDLSDSEACIDPEHGHDSARQLVDTTVGLNWYMSANSRVMLNYVMSDLEDVGKSNAFMTRLQIDF
jgi:phosphate-selective porin OprO/OprP